MLSFLFWNMGGDLPVTTPPVDIAARKKLILDILRNLVSKHNVDLLILAELPVSEADVLTSINNGAAIPFQAADGTSLCKSVVIFPRFAAQFMIKVNESKRYTGRLLKLPARKPFLLFAAHYSSKLRRSDDSQTLAAPGLSAAVRKTEKSKRIERTVLVGDLNMHPFDAGMVGAEAFNAVMTADLAAKESRKIDESDHPFFYNPMWSHYGDSTHEDFPPGHADHQPAGTCCYQAAESKWYYWNMFDQVLIRPALLKVFKSKEVKILTEDGTNSLLTPRGWPDRDRVSDHLPLLFRLHL